MRWHFEWFEIVAGREMCVAFVFDVLRIGWHVQFVDRAAVRVWAKEKYLSVLVYVTIVRRNANWELTHTTRITYLDVLNGNMCMIRFRNYWIYSPVQPVYYRYRFHIFFWSNTGTDHLLVYFPNRCWWKTHQYFDLIYSPIGARQPPSWYYESPRFFIIFFRKIVLKYAKLQKFTS